MRVSGSLHCIVWICNILVLLVLFILITVIFPILAKQRQVPKKCKNWRTCCIPPR